MLICLLRVTEGPAAGRQCWMREDQRLSIGRISTSDFPVPADMHMSRFHLILEGVAGRFRLRDVGSSNGTFLNDSLVTQAEVSEGDRIRAGSSVFVVTVQGELVRSNREAGGADPVAGYGTASGGAAPGTSPDSDLSPTRQYTRSELEQIPLRSVNHALPAGKTPAGGKGAEWPSTSATDGPAPSSPAKSALAPAGNDEQAASSVAPLASPDAGPDAPHPDLVWLEGLDRSGFQPTDAFGLRFAPVQALPVGSPPMDWVASWIGNERTLAIVNVSQLLPNDRGLADALIRSGTATRVSQSLMMVPWTSDGMTRSLLQGCTGRDALILAGNRDGGARVPWASAVDICGYPSLLLSLLKARDGLIVHRLEQLCDWVLMEDLKNGGWTIWLAADSPRR